MPSINRPRLELDDDCENCQELMLPCRFHQNRGWIAELLAESGKTLARAA